MSEQKGKKKIMVISQMLFVGIYPNPADPYRNVFFQNLIFSFADHGVNCTVIMPVSVTHYKEKIKIIPLQTVHTTEKGNTVHVYYPRCFTYSAKQIGNWNTGQLSEYSFQRCAVRQAKKLKQKFDCVYGHFFLEGGLAAAAVGRTLGIPSFIAYGECDYESEVRQRFRDLKARDIKGLKGLISVSSDNSRELRMLSVLADIPILLAPNSIDPDIFHPMDKHKCRDQFGMDHNQFIVGFVGGFIERKGDKRVLAAIEPLDNVYGAFAGKGDEKPSGPKVVYCQPLKHEMIPAFLNACDIFVLPTLSEGCCNAIIEAMACGLPVVSSDLPFNHDILNETNSILIDPMRIDGIKDAIVRLKNDASLRQRLSHGALGTAKQLTIEARMNKINHFIENNSFFGK